MKVTSFEHACKLLKLNPKRCLPGVSRMPKKHRAAALATAKMYIIVEAMNEGHVFDWNSYSEDKWTNYFWLDKPGFRFDGSCCAFTYSDSTGGSRLCFRAKAEAQYAAKKFFKLYRDMMVIPK